MASWNMPYDQLTEEAKSRAWFIAVSSLYEGSTQKWRASMVKTLFCDNHETGKPSQWAEFWALHFACYV